MRRLILSLAVLAGAIVLTFGELQAWFWESDTLVTINSESFTKKDFDHWWKNWRAKDTPFPDTPEPFIEWHILAQEAVSMELFREQSYRQKVETFLKARALMLLKNEAIDSKINIGEQDLWNTYREQYVPRRHVQIRYFDLEPAAQRASEGLNAGLMTTADTEDAAEGEKPQRIYDEWLRPDAVPEKWREVLEKMGIGQASVSVQMDTGFVVLVLKEERGAEDADFRSVEQRIREKLRKQREAELTADLIDRLRKKYDVKVDNDLFAILDPEKTPVELLDKPLITTSRNTVSVGLFLRQLDKEQKFLTQNRFKKVDMDALKNRVLGGIISQTLTSWEAMDRHFENRPPFKWIYRFYCQHRLIRELEKRLIHPKAQVEDSEVEAYYIDHRREFTQPETVSVVVLEDDPRLIDKLWNDIRHGEDFFLVVKKYYSREIPVQRVPLDHLPAAVKQAVGKLSKGEVSVPLQIDGQAMLIRLVDRHSENPIPFGQVTTRISERLSADKFAEARENLLKELRARSKIEVNEKAWKELKKRYEER
jgi:parvulin-like peptidyl-prolyl isomerase